MEAQEKRPQYMFLFPSEGYFVNAGFKTGMIRPSDLVEYMGYMRFHDKGKDGNIIKTLLPEVCRALFDIIDARYRNRNYRINWLMFCKEEDKRKPYMESVPKYVGIKREDGIIISGITVSEVQSKSYANPDFVLDQLPPHDSLVLGGFHQFDCVDMIAKRSHERGVETFVDEDTTEVFFHRVSRKIEIPNTRTDWRPEALGLDFFKGNSYQARKGKPWFVQEDGSVPEFMRVPQAAAVA